jgi:hypothetical protein
MGATSEMKVTEQSKRGRGGGSIHKQKYQPLTGTFEKAVTGRSNTTSTACRFAKIPTRRSGRCGSPASETARRN